ncbi:hypothetical protein EVAR_56993_1 [Eumeta japonica]|uniref:Uncharacterized protein n=1 Tax=Eumeta variegata TaxID=151549 RepID=A0A4C1Z7Z6_EUMVA|nr:hypothetical protein EVAR_56993_1 [Eumeta japonica]
MKMTSTQTENICMFILYGDAVIPFAAREPSGSKSQRTNVLISIFHARYRRRDAGSHLKLTQTTAPKRRSWRESAGVGGTTFCLA